MRILSLSVGLVVALLAATPADAAQGATSCKTTPRDLQLKRTTGSTIAVLSWKAPRRGPKNLRYRVTRGGKVLGQTRKRTFRVRVSVGKRVTFRVRRVRKGRALRGCSLKRTFFVAHQGPARPQHLAAGDASGASVQLTWSPSRGGDSRVAGYRVLRDGASYKQTSETRLSVPLASNRAYTFTVLAVDRRGRLSPPSAPVTVRTGHQPPPSPAGLAASDVTDSAVTLSWQPSVPARGTVTAYRIVRDGVVVRQVAATSARVDRLWASRDHVFSVMAVDGLGYVSAPATTNVRTADPVPTQGSAHAFLLASTGRSFEDFQEHYRSIGTVYPTFYDCDPSTAELHGRHDELVTRWAQARKVQVLPRFNCQRGDVLGRILNQPALRTRWLDGIVGQVDQYGYDGANIDFEAGAASDRDALTRFVAELAARLHARGKKLSIDVSAKTADVPDHPRSTFFDYVALSKVADHVLVMAWGIHWATSDPGPQDDIAWVRNVVSYIGTVPDKQKFVLGMQLYAMDWPIPRGEAESADTYEYPDAMRRAQEHGVTPVRDTASDTMHFAYTGADGRPREVWFTDASTQATRVQLAKENGLGGIGFWRLGHEDQRLWDMPLLAPGAVWR